jgi:hypothetical protein
MSSKYHSPCNVDLDCEGILTCIPNTTVFWVQQEVGYSFCGCNAGIKSFSGEHCDIPHASKHLHDTYYAFVIIITIIGIYISTKSLWELYWTSQASNAARSTITWRNPLVQTAILLLFGSIVSLSTTVISQQCAEINTEYIVYFNVKYCPLFWSSIITAGLSFLLNFLGLINISLTWIDMVVKIQSRHHHSSVNNKTVWSIKLIIFVRILQTAFVLSLIYGIATFNLALGGAMILPFGLITIILYSIGGSQITKLLKQATTTSTTITSTSNTINAQKALTHIRITMIAFVITMSLAVIFIGAAAIITIPIGELAFEHGGWDRPGEFCTCCGYFFLACTVLVVQWFVWKSSTDLYLKHTRGDGTISTADPLTTTNTLRFPRQLRNNQHIQLIDDGDITRCTGATLSILSPSTLQCTSRDSFFGLRFPRFSTLLEWNIARMTLLVISSTLLTIGVVFILLPSSSESGSTTPLIVSIVFQCVVLGLSIVISAIALSKPVLFVLWHTEWMAARSVTCLFGGVLLMLALDDVRAIFVPGLTVLQLLAFSTDALAIPRLRSILIASALFPTLSVFVMIVFGFAGKLRNVILPIGDGYSLLQSVRDFLLVQTIFFIVEILHVFRGRDKKRFLHITSPVTCVVVSLEEARKHERKRNHGRYEANASSVQGQSGFFMRNVSMAVHHHQDVVVSSNTMDTETSQLPLSKTRVYVNKIAIRCTDSLAVHLFGETFYEKLTSPLMNLLYYGMLILPIIPSTLIMLDSRAGFAVLPFMVVMMLREALVSSVTLLKLLLKRVAFVGSLILNLVWVCIACYAVGGDARMCVAFYGFVADLTLVLQDANTVKGHGHGRIRKSLVSWLSGLRMVPTFILSLYLILDVLPGTKHAILVVNGGTTGTATGNDVQAIDVAQQAGDLGMFSVALPVLVKVFWDVGRRVFVHVGDFSNEDLFTSIASPVVPIFDLEETVAVSEEQIQSEVGELVSRLVERSVVMMPRSGGGGATVYHHNDNNNANNVHMTAVVEEKEEAEILQ